MTDGVEVAVGRAQSLETVVALLEIDRRGEDQIDRRRERDQIGNRGQAVLLGEFAGDRQRLRVVHRRLVEPDEIVLFLVALVDIVIDSNRSGSTAGDGGTGFRRSAKTGHVGERLAQHHEQTGAGVFRIEIEIAGEQRFLRDHRAAEVELALDREVRRSPAGGHRSRR